MSFESIRIKMQPVFVAALLLLLLLPTLATADVDAHRIEDAQTEWYWQSGLTPAEVTNFINANGVRIIDIEIYSTSPFRLTASFVKNQGTYASGWWWYYGLNFNQVADFVDQNNARLIDIERYLDPTGAERFAVVMVPNVGDQAKAWWYYAGITSAQISGFLSANEARLVDIESYSASGGRRYAVIMIRNSGEDAAGWGWFFNTDLATISSWMQDNNMRLLEFEVRDAGTLRFDAVLISRNFHMPKTWWWYYNVPASAINGLWKQAASRITDIDTYIHNDQRYYNIVMLSNANDLTVQMGQILDWGRDGSTGAFLREVNGTQYAYLQPDFIFEPASSLKAVHHLHTMRDVMSGAADLNDLVNYSVNYNGSCPQGGAPFTTQTLQETLRRMMVNSDNAATKGITDIYGFNAITATAQLVAGMSDTEVNHTLGCGNEAVVNPNQLTLRDITHMYGLIETQVVLDEPNRDIYYSLMQNKNTPGAWWFNPNLRALVNEVAGNLGMPQTTADALWSNMRFAWKPGGYTLNSRDYISVGGIVTFPDCTGWPTLRERHYSFGVFVHNASTNDDAFARVSAAAKEMFRDRIEAALLSCPTAVDELVPMAQSVTLGPASPNPFNPSTQLSFDLPRDQDVRLAIYDMRGREVAVLAAGQRAAGRHEVRWNGRDGAGRDLPAGVYLARLVVGDQVETQKLALIK